MSHNLDIRSYSLDELLGLFDLGYQISAEDLKRAKKKVLMLHPDKSRLGPEYFLFYKKAFDQVVQFYEHQNRASQPVSQRAYVSQTENVPKSLEKQVRSNLEKIPEQKFNEKFNELFDKNMAKQVDPEKYSWFSQDDDTFAHSGTVTKSNMGEVFNSMKQKTQALTQYRGVAEMVSPGSGTNFYEDDEADDVYVSSDPFSKLKFDDLRKVHKDQTILPISENDYQNVPKYSSVDHFVRERNRPGQNEPISKQQAEMLLQQKEEAAQKVAMQRQHKLNLQMMENAEKNKSVLSHFLLLDNGKR